MPIALLPYSVLPSAFPISQIAFHHAASAAISTILMIVVFDSHTACALLLQLLYLSLRTRAAKNFTERRTHKQ